MRRRLVEEMRRRPLNKAGESMCVFVCMCVVVAWLDRFVATLWCWVAALRRSTSYPS